MTKGQWVFDPDSGGKKISETVKTRTSVRIRRYAEEHFAGRYIRLDIRFRGQFCYIDAFAEPDVAPDCPPLDWGETHQEMVERLRNSPVHLCRLRFFGNEDRWGYAFFTYSIEKYELSVFPSGDFLGTPEDAFLVSANMYL